jgi:hypothetical protein
MNTTAGVTMFFMFPLVASASILYWTSREKLPKPLVHNNEKTLIVKEPSLTPFPVRDAIKVTIVGTKELIVFRFLLIAWGIGLLILIFFGSSYLMIKWSQNAVFDEAIACLKRVEKETTDCKAPQVEKNGTCTYLSNLCSNEIDRMTEKETRAESWLYEDLWLFIVPSFLFYGIRWAITGRLKPLWLIR